jgi:hypothetical protein
MEKGVIFAQLSYAPQTKGLEGPGETVEPPFLLGFVAQIEYSHPKKYLEKALRPSPHWVPRKSSFGEHNLVGQK